MTKDEITIGVIAGFGGPYGPVIGATHDNGFVTWQKEVNANRGIHGRSVQLKKIDHKETADGGVAACREAADSGVYLVITIEGQGEANTAAANCLDKLGVTNVAEVEADPRWKRTYTMLASGTDQGRSLGGFVKNVMGAGAKKLGVIYLRVPRFVQAKDAYVREARALGMDVVAAEAVEPNQGSFTPQLLRLRNAGVENLAIIAVIEAVGILRDARALNYQPNFTGVLWQFDFITQAARDTAKGAQGLALTVTTDRPAFASFKQKRNKYNPSPTPADSVALIYYGFGLLAGRVLEAAGPNPTAGGLRTAIESIKGYDNGILPPLTWGPGDFVGSRASFPAACCTSNWTWRGLGRAREQF